MSRNPFDAARDALYKKLSGAGLGKVQTAVALCFLNNTSRIKYDAAEGLLSYPGQRRLVEETGLDRRQIRRIIKRLVALGFMELEREHQPSRISDRYRLNEDWQPLPRGFQTEKARAAKAAKKAAAETGGKTDTGPTGGKTESQTGGKTEPKVQQGAKQAWDTGQNRAGTGGKTEQKSDLFCPVPSVLPTVGLPTDAPAELPLPPPLRDDAAQVATTSAPQGGEIEKLADQVVALFGKPRASPVDGAEVGIWLSFTDAEFILEWMTRWVGKMRYLSRAPDLKTYRWKLRDTARRIRKGAKAKTAEDREHEARWRTDRLLVMVEPHWRPSRQDEIEQIRQAFRDGINGGALKWAIHEAPLPLDLPATIELARARQARYKPTRTDRPAAGEVIH